MKERLRHLGPALALLAPIAFPGAAEDAAGQRSNTLTAEFTIVR